MDSMLPFLSKKVVDSKGSIGVLIQKIIFLKEEPNAL